LLYSRYDSFAENLSTLCFLTHPQALNKIIAGCKNIRGALLPAVPTFDSSKKYLSQFIFKTMQKAFKFLSGQPDKKFIIICFRFLFQLVCLV